MASPPTIPCLTIGKHREIAQSVARILAPHGFSVNGIINLQPWSDSELALVLRVLEPHPQALLIGGGFSDEEGEKAQSVFNEYMKEVGITNGKVVRVERGTVDKNPPNLKDFTPIQYDVPSSEAANMEILSLPTSLNDSLITSLPASGYYVPNFITPTEEKYLLEKIDSVPLPTWKHLSHRRLQAHPFPLSPSNTLLAADLPTWLSDPVIPRLLSIPISIGSKDNIFGSSPHSSPNHCLVNEYRPGQGIRPHEDGGAYYPVVATVSLGSHIVLDIKAKDGAKNATWRILQEPRSLLITTAELYTECLHGIDEVKVDENLDSGSIVNWDLLGDKEAFRGGIAVRETRVSLTFRDVKRVQKLGKAFGGLGRK